MNLLKKVLPLAILSVMLAGCATLFPKDDENASSYPAPRFTSEAPIQLKVNRVNIISEFTPRMERPNVEHLFPVLIEKTAKTWAQDRLKAADFSSPKIAEVIIKDASVTEKLEENQQLFDYDRIVYRATLTVVVRITDPDSMSRAQTEVEAWRELKIPADTDIAEKEKYWNGMAEKLFADFNTKMTDNIYKYLNMYVINQPLTPTYY